MAEKISQFTPPNNSVLHALSPDEVAGRMKQHARQGWGEYQIAELFRVRIEQGRRILGCRDCGE